MQAVLNETKTHGTLTFPYTVYKVDIPKFIKAYPLHRHASAELIYIESGEGTVSVGTTRYHVHGGDIVIVMPDTAHAIEQYECRTMNYFNVLFDLSMLGVSPSDPCYAKYIAPFFTHEKLSPEYVPNGDALNTALRPHVSYLVQNRKARGDELMIKSELFAIMSRINSFVENNADTSHNFERRAIMPALDYIHESYDKKIFVAHAAKLCGYSKSHFMKLFKTCTGKSFAEYAIEYRVEVAARMLIGTDKKILDISLDCGFDNPSYFARAIKKKYGLTPSELRKTAEQ